MLWPLKDRVLFKVAGVFAFAKFILEFVPSVFVVLEASHFLHETLIISEAAAKKNMQDI